MRLKTAALLPFLVTLLWSSPSSAHKLNVFAWAENNLIIVESSLSGGRTLVHGTITVIDTQTEEIIITGKSDINGTFSFALPEEILNQSPPLDIIVSGGDGHKAHWLMQPEDYGSKNRSGSLPPEPARQLVYQQNDNNDEACLSRVEFEHILNLSLEQKLSPIRKNIASRVNPSPTVRDIGGGIGYLVGCAGIAAWFRSRKQQKQE